MATASSQPAPCLDVGSLEDAEPSHETEGSVKAALERASDLLDCADGPTTEGERAIHCHCSLGPDSTRCIDQLSEEEISQVR